MTIFFTEGKWVSTPFFLKPFLLLTLLFNLSCDTEEFVESSESNVKEDGTIDRVTPVNGGVYYLKNRKSGLHLDVHNASNISGANVQQWGNASGTHRQWEVISTSDGYVRLKGVDSGKSLTTEGGSNANGANVEIGAYDNSTHMQWEIVSTDSGYFRLKSRDSGKSVGVQNGSTSNGANIESRSWNGGTQFQWLFIKVDGDDGSNDDDGGDNDDDGDDDGDNNNNDGSDNETANGIIGSGWKLNGFSGSLSVGSNDNGLDYADDASTNESHFFFEGNGFATFRCYPGNPTSGGSSNPRSELRELIGGGDNYWDGTTSTEHAMKWRFKIEDLPPSGKLCFGQIHERNDDFDDVIRVQVQGDEGQNSGNVDLRILGYVTEELEGGGRTIDFDMNMDTAYYFELTMKNSVVRLYELNNSGNRVSTLYTSQNVGDADENYFKAGTYLQSTQNSDADSDMYGQVAIKDLSVSH